MKHDPALMDMIRARHSVRKYRDLPIEADTAAKLQALTDEINRASGLHMQLFLDEPRGMDSLYKHFGFFAGVRSYLALVGRDDERLDETCGYYGELFVLRAQQLGLNSCWVGGTYSKGNCPVRLRDGERLALVIALGYGKTPGKPRRSKAPGALCRTAEPMPDWFARGMEAAMLAPTAMNRQAFLIELLPGKRVRAVAKAGPFTRVDLGIVKLHFEIGAGEEDWQWTE